MPIVFGTMAVVSNWTGWETSAPSVGVGNRRIFDTATAQHRSVAR